MASVKRSELLAEEKRGFEKLISDQQRKERAEEERQTLSELRTIESGDGGPIVPKVRTGAAINRKYLIHLFIYQMLVLCDQIQVNFGI